MCGVYYTALYVTWDVIVTHTTTEHKAPYLCHHLQQWLICDGSAFASACGLWLSA